VRRLFVLTMLVLLPLRGLAADMLGIEMALARGAGAGAAVMAPDCLPQAHAHGDPAQAESDPGSDSCGSCELCLTALQLPAVDLCIASLSGSDEPPSRGTTFLSALPAPSLRPPIS